MGNGAAYGGARGEHRGRLAAPAKGLGDERLSIGQMARLNAVSVKTLHVYQEKGLLEPRHVDPDTGYRYYTLDQCPTLDAIYQLKSLGFSLDEIAQTLASSSGGRGTSELRRRVQEHLVDLEERRRELDFSESFARTMLATCDLIDDEPLCDRIMIERLPRRKALVFDVPDVTPRDVNNAEWELAVRSVKIQLSERGLPPALFQNVSGLVEEDELRRRTIVTRKALIFVDDQLARHLGDAAVETPSGPHLVMYKRRALSADGSSPEYRGILDMVDYAFDHGFDLAGPYVGETLASTPLFAYRGRDSFFKMCLPVRQGRTAKTAGPAARSERNSHPGDEFRR